MEQYLERDPIIVQSRVSNLLSSFPPHFQNPPSCRLFIHASRQLLAKLSLYFHASHDHLSCFAPSSMLHALTQTKGEKQCGTKMMWSTEWYEHNFGRCVTALAKFQRRYRLKSAFITGTASGEPHGTGRQSPFRNTITSKCNTDFHIRSLCRVRGPSLNTWSYTRFRGCGGS
jgi:hypothetical protein